MARYLEEYVNKLQSKNWGILKFREELQELITQYNVHTGRCLFVYAADLNKGRMINKLNVGLDQDDFYMIQDILSGIEARKLDFYIETPGGSGTAAEEIAVFLRNKFEDINFVIAGEAKSAGTILALSGDDISMTETGSLGPIDAQIALGRKMISAYDYIAWVDEKREEAEKKGKLNPFDAVMVAQITPGELKGIINALEFAKILVSKWLAEYKFKNWKVTETKKIKVTDAIREKRAKEVSEILVNQSEWKTHGRSLKIDDLKEVLLINRIDEDKTLAEIVYRIKTVIRMIFDMSTEYKLFFLDNFKMGKSVNLNQNNSNQIPSKNIKSAKQANFTTPCMKCRKKHSIVAAIGPVDPKTKALLLKNNKNINNNDKLICDNCKFEMDLKPIKNNLELQTTKKVTFK